MVGGYWTLDDEKRKMMTREKERDIDDCVAGAATAAGCGYRMRRRSSVDML